MLSSLGCRPDPGLPPDDSDPEDVGADLTVPVPSGEARAGRVVDPAVLPDGIAAEGRPGDLMLVNDRVRFVVQGLRDGNFYVTEWGGVIDADVVASASTEGDMVEKWVVMVGLGRILEPTAIEIVADGEDGGPAVVRVVGTDGPLHLIEGAVETPGFVTLYGLEVEQTYTLHPDSPLLEVTTTVTTPVDASFGIADVLFGSPEVSTRWEDGGGFDASPDEQRTVAGYVSTRGAGAAVTLAPDASGLGRGGLDLVAGLADISVMGTSPVAVPAGETVSLTRWYGVGAPLSAVTDAWLEAAGMASAARSGVVTAPDGPVPRAWVHLLRDGVPWSLTTTGPEGAWSAQVPTDGAITSQAVGVRDGLTYDLPAGPRAAPYADPLVRARVLESLAGPPQGLRPAEGRGVASSDAPDVLAASGSLTVSVADGAPFAVRVLPTAQPVAVPPTLSPGPPGGMVGAGWSRGEALTLEVPPGAHRVVVHRGGRFSHHVETIQVVAGEEAVVDAVLDAAYDHAGWWSADPHSHASPSGDGGLTMEERLVVTAAHGVQIHVGTDHDHVADYRPVLAALGLGDHLVSVVADEVSPPLRGHMNLYPLVSDPEAVNGGAWSWWESIPTSTEAILDALRARHGPEPIVQLNHPLSSGVASSAGWVPGTIRRPNAWTDRFEAVEVLNGGSPEGLPFWWDVSMRGMAATAVGVSDSHGPLSGDVGLSTTFVAMDNPSLAGFDPAAFAAAVRAGRTVVSRGPWLSLSQPPGFEALPSGTELTVTARSPDWIGVDRLRLLRDGAVVETVDGTTATFILSPDADAVYAVEAVGDAAMSPVSGRTPWAFAGPYRVDAAGDGWTPPAPPLVLED